VAFFDTQCSAVEIVVKYFYYVYEDVYFKLDFQINLGKW